jgi:hypothetical protein
MELQSVEINSLIVQNNGVSTRMIFTNEEETQDFSTNCTSICITTTNDNSLAAEYLRNLKGKKGTTMIMVSPKPSEICKNLHSTLERCPSTADVKHTDGKIRGQNL